METITAVIPAKNEEKHIERCIESLKWCDKIIVMWMGNDKTGTLAKQLGVEVISKNQSKTDNFTAVQKNINWAIDHCTTDWMIRVDADEVVTPELKDEIRAILTPGGAIWREKIIAYGIPRAQFFCGRFLKGGDWAYDRLIRCFKPQFCRYDPIVNVHEQFKVNGSISYLKNKLLHYSHPTMKDVIDKFQKYTDVEILDLHISKAQAFWRLLTQPTYVFLRWMIWHQGYRDGLYGVLAGAMRGWYEYLLYSKYLFKKT